MANQGYFRLQYSELLLGENVTDDEFRAIYQRERFGLSDLQGAGRGQAEGNLCGCPATSAQADALTRQNLEGEG